jgi:hypothetical protein
MERRTVVYRGATREQAESAYHDDARKAATDGFVPTSENWSVALGQQVLTVDYLFQPDQAPAVLAALSDVRSLPVATGEPAAVPPPLGAPAVALAPAKSGTNPLVGCLALVAVVVVAYLAVGRGNSGGSDSATPPPAAPAAVSHLTGTFLRWEPVDEQNGYAYFSITNTGTSTETATCTISVENDFGDFGFDILVGEPVGPGETISGNIPISVGEGSFLINKGEVTNC